MLFGRNQRGCRHVEKSTPQHLLRAVIFWMEQRREAAARSARLASRAEILRPPCGLRGARQEGVALPAEDVFVSVALHVASCVSCCGAQFDYPRLREESKRWFGLCGGSGFSARRAEARRRRARTAAAGAARRGHCGLCGAGGTRRGGAGVLRARSAAALVLGDGARRQRLCEPGCCARGTDAGEGCGERGGVEQNVLDLVGGHFWGLDLPLAIVVAGVLAAAIVIALVAWLGR